MKKKEKKKKDKEKKEEEEDEDDDEDEDEGEGEEETRKKHKEDNNYCCKFSNPFFSNLVCGQRGICQRYVANVRRSVVK